jgi:hypothetical protein
MGLASAPWYCVDEALICSIARGARMQPFAADAADRCNDLRHEFASKLSK